MKKMTLLVFYSGVCSLLFLLISSPVFAVSMNFSGTFRSEGDYFNNINLNQGSPNTKAFFGARALLQPDLVIDDHFSVRSQWSLLQSPTLTPAATNLFSATSNNALATGQGGYILGDPNTQALVLSRVWLEWVSDFGLLRVGRMPVSWGYGLVYDSGEGMWDNFQTTFDRIEYRLNLGHLVGAVSVSKPFKGSVISEDSDSSNFTAYLQYDNPESEIQAGIMYERQIRSGSQQAPLTGNTPQNPYYVPNPPNATNYQKPPLSQNAPSPSNNNLVDLYLKKTSGYFTFGGEVSWLTGSAYDLGNTGNDNPLNAFGFIANVTYEYHSIKAFLEFLYASGDNTVNQGHLNGFTELNRNRSPGLILGRELLGVYYGNNVGMGSLVYYGSNNSFSGVYYLRPGFRVEWSPSWASGIEALIANKAAVAADETANLGLEVDLGTEYSPYKNFDVGVTLGYLFPGTGLRVTTNQGIYAARLTAGVRF
jgi:hypothetical protein